MSNVRNDTGPRDPAAAPSSVLGSRLAGSLNGGPAPSWTELGLDDAKAVAFRWQKQRSYSQLNEMAVLTKHYETSRWVSEIHGLIGVVGELLLVSIEAEIEKAILARNLADESADEDRPAAVKAQMKRSSRFFAEGQGNQLTIAGHALANLTVRTLVLHPSLELAPLARKLGFKPNQFVPRSAHRQAWLSLTERAAEAMCEGANTLNSTELVGLTEALAAIVQDADVAALKEARDSGYHRWRGESPGVTGINISDSSMIEAMEQGYAIGIGRDLLPEFTDGSSVLERIQETSRKALDAYVRHLDPFLTTWYDAFNATTA